MGSIGKMWFSSQHHFNMLLGSRPIEVLYEQIVYLRFKTDDSIEHSGINISFIALSNSRKLLLRSYSF